MRSMTVEDADYFDSSLLSILPPLSAIHLRVKLASKSPLIPSPSFDFSYLASSGTVLANDVQDLANHVVASINAIPSGGTNAPVKYLSPVLSTAANACTWEAFDVSAHLDGTPAGSPVVVGSFTLGTPGASGSCPEGSSATITLQAPYGTDVEFLPGSRPRARDRGRIYWGPLSATLAFNADTNGRTTLGPSISGDLPKWIKSINIYTSSPSTIPWNLAVWSRKAQRMKSLAEVWLDDRPDYQRRRGGKSGNKTIVTLP